MLVMDVAPIMDEILTLITRPTDRSMQLSWYSKDSRKHVDTNSKNEPIKAEDLVPKSILDLFDNRSELVTLVLNNPKKFENCSDNNIFVKSLQNLKYAAVIIGYGKYKLVKIPSGYTQTISEMKYSLVKDSEGKYWDLEADGSVEKITEDYFYGRLSDEDMEQIKKGPDQQTNERMKILATIYQQVQESLKGEDSATDIDSIIAKVDTLPDELFSDPSLQMLVNDGEHDIPVTKEQFIADITDYIQTKKKDGLNNFISDFGYQNVNNLLDTFLTSVEEIADNYKEC